MVTPIKSQGGKITESRPNKIEEIKLLNNLQSDSVKLKKRMEVTYMNIKENWVSITVIVVVLIIFLLIVLPEQMKVLINMN